MVDTIQPRSLSSFRTQKRRHDHRMNRLGTENPRASRHYVGWKAPQIFLLLPVAGEVFPLTFPFYRTALPPTCGLVLRLCDLPSKWNWAAATAICRKVSASRRSKSHLNP